MRAMTILLGLFVGALIALLILAEAWPLVLVAVIVSLMFVIIVETIQGVQR